MAKVAKAFNSVNRRFKVGEDVEEADVVDAMLSWDDLVAKKFIATTPASIKKIDEDVKAAEKEEAKSSRKSDHESSTKK